MAHAQKSDFVFRRNGRVHLNRRERQFSLLLAAEVCASAFIVGSNAGYTMYRGSLKGTGYPLLSPISPLTSPPVRHRVPSHFNWSLQRSIVKLVATALCRILREKTGLNKRGGFCAIPPLSRQRFKKHIFLGHWSFTQLMLPSSAAVEPLTARFICEYLHLTAFRKTLPILFIHFQHLIL